ncbi:phage related protease [[Clostridium] sordellii]|uniref:head maturation protease, ClpP-related n=1 Tax=Paraclostridium sordellii TaxID=1505 RepID=UPI000541F099|nr:head maturation protease, ClpP-related [Paeniclostridium sordellii]CEK29410.1 phage related protease [[Clostridium] sordellii] [Paeniclostridium sordellii]
MNKRYYSLTQSEDEATIVIYGNITSWDWREKDVSSYTLSKQLEELDVSTINVYINSYGGEVAEGLAIYNNLKRHKAKVRTYCDGFACSIASVIFMAGDERIMSSASLLMIHNAWTYTAGNANDLRKEADDLEKITQASINVYMSEVNISEEELKQLLDDETWITPQEAFEKGFATTMINEKKNKNANQDAKKYILSALINNQKREKAELLAKKELEAKEKLKSLQTNTIEDDESNINQQQSNKENDIKEEPKQNNYEGSFFYALKNIIGGNDNGIIGN